MNMVKPIVILSLLWLQLNAASPIAGYERILKGSDVIYRQIKGDFSFRATRFIDSDNIDNRGSKDTYDDPYIATILHAQKPYKVIQGTRSQTIDIVFRTRQEAEGFIKNAGLLPMIQKRGLTVVLIVLDPKKIQLPLHLSVYPFFVIGDRFSQGYLSAKLLDELIAENKYPENAGQLTLKAFEAKIARKYNMTQDKVDVRFNKNIELFEVHRKGEQAINAYVSRDGRYIIFATSNNIGTRAGGRNN